MPSYPSASRSTKRRLSWDSTTEPRSRPNPMTAVRRCAALLRLRQGGPLVRLDADHRLVAALPVRLEDGGLAFADIEPVLAEGIHDVRLVRDDHDIAAGGRRRSGEL